MEMIFEGILNTTSRIVRFSLDDVKSLFIDDEGQKHIAYLESGSFIIIDDKTYDFIMKEKQNT